MIKFKIEGLDQLRRKFERLADNAAKAHGTESVPITELLNDAFMRSRTPFASLQEMIIASGVSEAEFAADPKRLDQFIASQTSFASWETLWKTAAKDRLRKKLFK